MLQLIEYLRRRIQGYSRSRALHCARDYRAGDTAVGLVSAGVILVLLAYALAEYIDNF